jgi:hypothetical protein
MKGLKGKVFVGRRNVKNGKRERERERGREGERERGRERKGEE